MDRKHERSSGDVKSERPDKKQRHVDSDDTEKEETLNTASEFLSLIIQSHHDGDDMCRVAERGHTLYIVCGDGDSSTVKCGYTSQGAMRLFRRYNSRFGPNVKLITFECNERDDEYRMHDELQQFVKEKREWYHATHLHQIVERTTALFGKGKQRQKDEYGYWYDQLQLLRKRVDAEWRKLELPESPDAWTAQTDECKELVLDYFRFDEDNSETRLWCSKITSHLLGSPLHSARFPFCCFDAISIKFKVAVEYEDRQSALWLHDEKHHKYTRHRTSLPIIQKWCAENDVALLVVPGTQTWRNPDELEKFIKKWLTGHSLIADR